MEVFFDCSVYGVILVVPKRVPSRKNYTGLTPFSLLVFPDVARLAISMETGRYPREDPGSRKRAKEWQHTQRHG